MKYFISTLTVAFLLAVSSAAYSQSQPQGQSQAQPQAQKPPEAQKPSPSLGELAKREKERREKVTAALKSLTNEDTGKYKDAAIATVAMPVPPEPEKIEGAEAQPKVEKVEKTESAPGSDEPVDFQGRNESFWRQTFTDARQKVKSLEDQGNVLTLKLNDLQNQFYREANGFRQQEIQREIQKTLYEQDKNKEELKKAKDELQDLDKEARKSGALPGWFSGKKP